MQMVKSSAAGTFLPEVNNGETIAVIEENNDTYYLQKWIEKFPLSYENMVYLLSNKQKNQVYFCFFFKMINSQSTIFQ